LPRAERREQVGVPARPDRINAALTEVRPPYRYRLVDAAVTGPLRGRRH
jgi:hypothetical protein